MKIIDLCATCIVKFQNSTVKQILLPCNIFTFSFNSAFVLDPELDDTMFSQHSVFIVYALWKNSIAVFENFRSLGSQVVAYRPFVAHDITKMTSGGSGSPKRRKSCRSNPRLLHKFKPKLKSETRENLCFRRMLCRIVVTCMSIHT